MNNGTVANPGQTQAADMGDQVVFSYTLSNPTRLPQVYRLDTRLEPATTPALSSTDVRLIVDSNRNGVIDPLESPVQLVRVPANQSIALLLQVDVPASANSDASTGSIFVNALASCASRPSVFDDDNVSSITLEQILPADPTFVKVADVNSNDVRPGDVITYTLRLSVGSQAVNDIIMRDPLHALLADPERLELLLDGNPAGNVRFEADTREVIAELDTAPAGSTVEWLLPLESSRQPLRAATYPTKPPALGKAHPPQPAPTPQPMTWPACAALNWLTTARLTFLLPR